MPLALLLGLLFPYTHPLHTSVAEVRLEPRTREVVVVVRVFADDFEAEVGREPRDADIAAWIRRGFVLRTAGGTAVELHLSERNRVADMLHFTLRAPAPSGLRGMRVHHALFFGRFADLVNLVRVRQGGRLATLLFTPGDRPVTLR